MFRKALKSGSFMVAAGAIGLSNGQLFAAQIDIGPENIAGSGWSFITYDPVTNLVVPSSPGYTGTFVTGPGTPPVGTGSVRLTTDAVLGSGAIKLSTNNFNGVLLSSLTQLSYSTYVTSNSGGTPTDGQQAPYVQIPVDYTNDGIADDRLFFEPVYQTGGYSMVPGAAAVPDQRGGDGQAPKIGTWETYNILAGGVWKDSDNAGGPPLDTFAHFIADHPTAKIINSSTAGGFQLVAGFGSPGNWNAFDGNVDAVTIDTGSGPTVYNFEASVPEPTGIAMVLPAAALLLKRRRRTA